jgi:uncharacterized protein (DUF924 family)
MELNLRLIVLSVPLISLLHAVHAAIQLLWVMECRLVAKFIVLQLALIRRITLQSYHEEFFMNYDDVLNFWFEQCSAVDWFSKNDSLDLKMVEKFIVIHSQAIAGELFYWRDFPLGRLAEIILIDQFSRNIYRDDAKAYANDSMALALAQEAIRNKVNDSLDDRFCQFLYMPFMHSESRLIHEEALKLFSEPGLEYSLKYEIKHKATIDQYNRYPERNAVLGRTNTPEEEDYLLSKNSLHVKINQTSEYFSQRH